MATLPDAAQAPASPGSARSPKSKSTSPKASSGGQNSPAGILTTQAQGDEEIGGDDDDGDLDESWQDDAASSTESISESILQYRTIHGRTFHSARGNAEYWGPNDERQNESLDISHHVFTLVLGGKLFTAPIPSDIQQVLDVGTGTGIWAIDFADQFPSAKVTGTDLSPTQPLWVPPNLKFEIDDCTQPWTWAPGTFDFVHERCLFGSIPDWGFFFSQAFKVLKPGGYLEVFEGSVDIKSDDDSIGPGHVMHDWGKLFAEAGRRMGRSMTIVDDEGYLLNLIKNAGFEDVVEQRFKVPLTGWSDDAKMKEIGTFSHVAVEEGLEGYALYMLTNVLGWSAEEVQVLIAKMRKAMKSKKNHGYYDVAVLYGRKPLA